MTTTPLPIIHINGFPGTGKLTIAKELQRLIGAPRCRLVHNHLLINPADAVLPRSAPGYQELRRALRQAVFATLAADETTRGCVYVFTDFQSRSPVGTAVCAEFRAASRARGCELVSVVLECKEEVNVARLTSVDREVHHKIVDPALLRSFRQRSTIHRYVDLPSQLELDVTEKTATEAAEQILQHLLTISPNIVAKEQEG